MKWLLDTERLDRAFFHSPEAPTRRVIHITSAVLGHASPKTSLLHYVHCMPWLSALCWQWNPEFWPPGHVIAQIAQVSLPNKPDDLPAPDLPAEIRHMQRIIGRMKVYTRALSLRASRKKKDETIESPSLASHRGTRMCRLPVVALADSILSASRRNTTRMHALCAFRRNNTLIRARLATRRG